MQHVIQSLCINRVLCIDAAAKWVSDAVPNELTDFYKSLCKGTVWIFKKSDLTSKNNKISKISKCLKISLTGKSEKTEGKLCPVGPETGI